MKTFNIVVKIEGEALYQVRANSEKEAFLLHEKGESQLVNSSWEDVSDTFEPPIIVELGDSNED